MSTAALPNGERVHQRAPDSLSSSSARKACARPTYYSRPGQALPGSYLTKPHRRRSWEPFFGELAVVRLPSRMTAGTPFGGLVPRPVEALFWQYCPIALLLMNCWTRRLLPNAILNYEAERRDRRVVACTEYLAYRYKGGGINHARTRLGVFIRHTLRRAGRGSPVRAVLAISRPPPNESLQLGRAIEASLRSAVVDFARS